MDLGVALRITAGVIGQQAVDQLRNSMERVGETVNGVSSKFGSLKGALGAMGAAAAVAGFGVFMKSIIDTADNLGDLSEKTGIAVEDLDALGWAAEMNGSNLDQISGALGKLANKMGDASGGSKEAIALFKQFGISQQELKSGSISTTEALGRIADKFANMPDNFKKTAVAQALFGKSAADIVPLLNQGGDAIRDARAELEGYGALFKGGISEAAGEFNDNMARLKRMASALGLSLLRELLPAVNGLINGLINLRKESGNLEGDTGLANWAESAALAIALLVDEARRSAQVISTLVGSFQAVWADIKLAGTFLAGGTGLNPFSSENKKILSDALEERNAVVAEANRKLDKLLMMDTRQTYNAVKSAIEQAKADFKAGKSGGKGGRGGDDDIDLNAGKERKETEFERLKQGLQEQIAKVGELSEAEKLLGLLSTDKYKVITASQREVLLGLANELDRTKTLADAQKEMKKRREQESEQLRQKREQEDKSNDDFRANADVAIKMMELEGESVNMTTAAYEARRAELEHQLQVQQATREMTAAGRDEYTRIADAIYAASRALADMQAAEAKTFGAGAKSAIRSYIADLEDVAGATEQAFTNAFKGMEDALVSFVMTGKLDFKSLATSILQDMARMAIQASIMRPLMGMFGGMFGMSAAPVAVATPIPTGFANGGIMTSRGSVPLNAYANGGIANSPQMALFGEGRLPEAYVPLPDGRTIPVTMQGGAGVGNNVTVNVSVENGGEQVKSNQGAGELGRAIAGAVRQELINQKRPGGLLAA